MKVLNWMIALFGLWEFADIAAPFTPGFGMVSALIWNHVIVGLILMLTGIRGALTNHVNTAKSMNWIAAFAGIWLMMASFLFGRSVHAAGQWNDFIVGLFVLILSLWAVIAPRVAR